MKTERECEDAANKALMDYINGCKCNSVEDVLRAVNKMMGVALNCRYKVANGKAEIVQ